MVYRLVEPKSVNYKDGFRAVLKIENYSLNYVNHIKNIYYIKSTNPFLINLLIAYCPLPIYSYIKEYPNSD